MNAIVRLSLAVVAWCLIPLYGLLGGEDIVINNVRIQAIGDRIIRIEEKGPNGFEDRSTFHIFQRVKSKLKSERTGPNDITIGQWKIHVPGDGSTAVGVSVVGPDGEAYEVRGDETSSCWLPSPRKTPTAWSFADSPRIVPPDWGALPKPLNVETHYPNTSGWDTSNDALDIYVILPEGDHKILRKELIKLVGPSEMVPLYALGAWDSRWFPYTETSALGQIESYRSRDIPLDVLVIDTDWRKGASHGYKPNDLLFPDLPRFFKRAHSRGVRVMFNDHPEPQADSALHPREMSYRYTGLTDRLREGLDIWWFDRNWHLSLMEPAEGLRKEVWGMRVYRDIIFAARPTQRPLLMANVDGIDNGRRHRPPNVVARRYPVHWTGDTGTSGEYLRAGIENAVHAGVHAMNAYVSEDLGGFGGEVEQDQYARWVQYGTLSPLFRLHCGLGAARMPWAFDIATEKIARDFLKMRYRLLPVLYNSAREHFEAGIPIVRRLDLFWPGYDEASRNDQYLLGRDILVAPVLGTGGRPVPSNWLETPRGQPGIRGTFYNSRNLDGEVMWESTFPQIEFEWVDKAPRVGLPADEFSACFRGKITNRQDKPIRLGVVADDGVRLWLDEELVIDDWKLRPSTLSESTLAIEPGETKQLRMDYMEAGLDAICLLRWLPLGESQMYERELWIPPGVWIDAWNGGRVSGPKIVRTNHPIDKIPIFVREGAIIPLAPPMQHTGEGPWDSITLDIFPRLDGRDSTVLYEDDGISMDYADGFFSKTVVDVSSDSQEAEVKVKLNARRGHYEGQTSKRAWIIRLRRPKEWPKEWSPSEVTTSDNRILPVVYRRRSPDAMPFGDPLGAPDSDVFEIRVPSTSTGSTLVLTVTSSGRTVTAESE